MSTNRLGDCQYRHDWVRGICNTCGTRMEWDELNQKLVAAEAALDEAMESCRLWKADVVGAERKRDELARQVTQQADTISQLRDSLKAEQDLHDILRQRVREAVECVSYQEMHELLASIPKETK